MTDIALKCTACHQPTAYLLESHDGLYCRLCGHRAEAPEGFVNYVPDSREPHSLAQRLMQFGPLTRIYQGPLWRGSIFFKGIVGLDFEQEMAVVRQAAGLQGHERILDLACGTGNTTRALAEYVTTGQILGLDLSRPMLEEAVQQRSSESDDRIDYLRASADDLPLADASLDLVVCCAALHLFPDIPAALGEISRVLAPGGRLVAGVFQRDPRLLARLIQGTARRVGGVAFFERDGLRRLLSTAGLGEPVAHHSQGPWLIFSAQRK